MLSAAERVPLILFSFIILALPASGQGLTRALNLKEGASIDVVNRFGRISVRAQPPTDDPVLPGKLTIASDKPVLSKEVKVDASSGHASITVSSEDAGKRIDLVLLLPERSRLKLETTAGAIEVSGNFMEVNAKTDTGTIAVDVPDDDIKYSLLWTQSRPRVLADFDLANAKEKSAGRFEVKGHYLSDEGKSKKAKSKGSEPEAIATGSSPDDADPDYLSDEGKGKKAKGKGSEPGAIATGSSPDDENKDKNSKLKDQTSVTLEFTTARGIFLLNVPPSDVLSDLRERPLTNAAKAIVRSGDSLLMEAIRRASPKYFGDYARTLPPLKREPSFSEKTSSPGNVPAAVKTALVRVTDINNRAIPGLGAGDFEVTENGTPREIISVSRSMAPFNLVLLLDVSGSIENYVTFIRKAARNFVETVDKNDRVSIVIFNDDVKVLSKFTTDKQKLSESLDTFDAGGGTAYYDALAYTIADTLRPLKGERTAIVVLTDGDDNRSFLPFDALTGSIQESGALIYPLYVPSGLIAAASQDPNGDIDPMRSKFISLTAKSQGEGDKLAKISGGVYYPISQISQIQRAYEDIVLQMRSAYNITFRSDANLPAGVSPRLKIRAKRDNTYAIVTSVTAAGE